MTFEPHCINSSLTIKDALVALNNLRNATLTLFVLNDNAQIIGTLTDGDIRRALVNGHGLDCTLDKVMHRDYKFIRQKEFTVANLRSFRDRRIMFIQFSMARIMWWMWSISRSLSRNFPSMPS